MFAYPAVLLLLILIPIFIIFFIVRGIARATAMQKIGDAELVKSLLSQISYARRRWKSLLWLLTITGVIVALARPIWGIETELVRTQGVQVVLVLDVSRSMDAFDIAPSRIDRMKFDMLDLVNQLEGNDVGIVLFAGEAFVYMPLTYDTGSVRVFLNNVSTSMTSVQGTNISAAIETAMTLFDERSGAQPVIIVASDGENHEVDPEEMIQLASEKNIIIHTIGYGTKEGSLVPIINQFGNLINYKTNDNNELVNSVLDDAVLRRISQVTGGIYYQVGLEDGIQVLVQSINDLQSGDLREELVTRPIERFGIFVALAVFALSIEILLSDTKERKS